MEIEESQNKEIRRLRDIFTLLSALFLILFGLSKMFGFMRDGLCIAYLGCNTGFFGYDGLMHLVSGMTIAAGLIWVYRKYPGAYVSQGAIWKDFLVLIAVAALIGVLWEILEFSFDHVRMVIFHINLINPNQMAQASNSDTMGDLTLGLLGASIMAMISRHIRLIW